MTRVRLLRHRQTKGAETDRSGLQKSRACSLLYPIILALASIILLATYLGYISFTYEAGYCEEQNKFITDEELIKVALQYRNREVERHGGIDAYEKYIKDTLNGHPEDAGRDFDEKDPSCCKVYRGRKAVMRACTLDGFPICVRLIFPPLKAGEWYQAKHYKYYERRGRTYLFDDCGKLQDKY